MAAGDSGVVCKIIFVSNATKVMLRLRLSVVLVELGVF